MGPTGYICLVGMIIPTLLLQILFAATGVLLVIYGLLCVYYLVRKHYIIEHDPDKELLEEVRQIRRSKVQWE